MGNNIEGEDSKDLRPFDKREENADNITKFDFVDYQRTKDDSIRNKIAEAYGAFSNKVSDCFYYKTNSRRKVGHLNCFISFEKEDFEQFGFLGLLDAIDRYNPFNNKNASFKTYARSRILGYIKDELRKPIFFSGPPKRKGKKIPLMFSLYRRVVERENDKFRLKNSKYDLEDKRTLRPIEEIIRTDSVSSFLNNGFSKRDYQIFVDYELGGYILKEAAERANVTESRACQIHSAIMEKLKADVKEKNLDFLDFIN